MNTWMDRRPGACEQAWKRVRTQTTHQVLRTAAGLDEALGDVPRVAQRVWTSDQLFGPSSPDGGREFCSMLNAAIRADDRALLTAVEGVGRRKRDR